MVYTFDFEINKHIKQDTIKNELLNILNTGDGRMIEFTVGKNKTGKRIARVKIDFTELFKTIIFLSKVYSTMLEIISIKETVTNIKFSMLSENDKTKLDNYTTHLQNKVKQINKQLDCEAERGFDTGEDVSSNTWLDYKKYSSEFFAITNFRLVYPHVV